MKVNKESIWVGLGAASGSCAYQIIEHGISQVEWDSVFVVAAFTMVFYWLFDVIRRRLSGDK